MMLVEAEDDAEDGGVYDGSGMGANTYANSLDHSDLRRDIKKALEEQDEVALAWKVDEARDLGHEYPYRGELDRAETSLYEMMQCPDQPMPTNF